MKIRIRVRIKVKRTKEKLSGKRMSKLTVWMEDTLGKGWKG